MNIISVLTNFDAVAVVVLWEDSVANDTLLLLHGAADDDADGEDEDSKSDPKRRIVILESASTIRAVSSEKDQSI